MGGRWAFSLLTGLAGDGWTMGFLPSNGFGFRWVDDGLFAFDGFGWGWADDGLFVRVFN